MPRATAPLVFHASEHSSFGTRRWRATPDRRTYQFRAVQESALVVFRHRQANAQRVDRASFVSSPTASQAEATGGAQRRAIFPSAYVSLAARQFHFVNIPFLLAGESNSLITKRTKYAKGEKHAAQGIGSLARWFEGWQGNDFHGQRGPEANAVLF